MTNTPAVFPVEGHPRGERREDRREVRSPLGLRATLILLGELLLLTVVVFAAVALGLLSIPGLREIAVPVLAGTVFLHAAAMLLTIHVGLRRAGTGWAGIGFSRPTARILNLLWQIPAVFVVLAIVQLLFFAVTGEVATSEGGVDSLFVGVGPVLVIAAFVGVGVLTPVWEEVVFRGLIYGGLRRRFGPLVAALLSASAFAVAHGTPTLIPYLVTVGLALAYLREFHTTLWAPIALHATVNIFVASVALASVSVSVSA